MKKEFRPQDILVAIKLLVVEKKKRSCTYAELAREIGISPAEMSNSIQRLESVHLYSKERQEVNRSSLKELLLFGVKYFYPVTVSGMKKGVPTAISYGPLAEKFKSREYEYVWPSEEGDKYGLAIEPIYKSIPKAVLKDKSLYAYLSLLEVLRVGKAREQNLAKEMLDEMIFA